LSMRIELISPYQHTVDNNEEMAISSLSKRRVRSELGLYVSAYKLEPPFLPYVIEQLIELLYS
jgi:hypothetical protein